MTTERQPTAQDIRALVHFLPKLYGDGARPPIARWTTETEDGALVLPWPEYDKTVRELHRSDREPGLLDGYRLRP